MSSYVINKQEYIKAGGFFAGLADQRITPACAGKSLCVSEYFANVIQTPPLARGKALKKCSSRFCSRITPACAGKRS